MESCVTVCVHNKDTIKSTDFNKCHDQGWHIGIGRYRISADKGHIGKTDISVSVVALPLKYRPICDIGSSLHIGQYR